MRFGGVAIRERGRKMEQIELVFENVGVRKRATFPCTEAEYRAIRKALLLKDNYAYVRETIKPKEFGFKRCWVQSGFKQ